MNWSYITIRIEKTSHLERWPITTDDLAEILQLLKANEAKAIALDGEKVIAEI